MANICENLTLKGYSPLKEARVFRHTFFRPLSEWARHISRREKKLGGRGLRLPDLMRMLRITITSLLQVFICVNALDEYIPKYLPDLLESLRDIVRESPTTRISLTGRSHVRGDIQKHFSMAVAIPINPNAGDIKNYLETRLSRDPEPEAMNNDLWVDVRTAILKRYMICG